MIKAELFSARAKHLEPAAQLPPKIGKKPRKYRAASNAADINKLNMTLHQAKFRISQLELQLYNLIYSPRLTPAEHNLMLISKKSLDDWDAQTRFCFARQWQYIACEHELQEKLTGAAWCYLFIGAAKYGYEIVVDNMLKNRYFLKKAGLFLQKNSEHRKLFLQHILPRYLNTKQQNELRSCLYLQLNKNDFDYWQFLQENYDYNFHSGVFNQVEMILLKEIQDKIGEAENDADNIELYWQQFILYEELITKLNPESWCFLFAVACKCPRTKIPLLIMNHPCFIQTTTLFFKENPQLLNYLQIITPTCAQNKLTKDSCLLAQSVPGQKIIAAGEQPTRVYNA